MSRIGKKPILIPENVNMMISDNKISVKGPLGSLNREVSKKLKFNFQDNQLIITRIKENKLTKSLHGLYRVLINNMILGVTIGFMKKLELVGIGYRASCNKNILDLNLGFSHNIMIQIPEEVHVEVKSEKGKNTILVLQSKDKQLLGIIAAKIKSFRPPEPYKGKGIRYLGEDIRRKTGKSA
ncbi:50S ribosomal protein L6 [Blattabacterium cuenoti]|uniref:50S ribosomal protein L6 n=1 Tax=Blattabacterium cuenoti TaxID=1653831 RepID=UPI00163CF3BB|nr:50S ribosomal protein L6 [Blattabacterium cuenoti]